jgi:regulator of sirC expression with transglutaminase-like and TPR domain
MIDLSESLDFLDIVARPDQEIDLAAGALLIARDEYPGLDVAAYLARLDSMAREARPAIAAAGDNPFAVIDALNTYLFAVQGFHGNREMYFDPRNSYLNDVLDLRRGIPITLSVIYMEIGSRLGFPLEGVGFPGHFMVRHAAAGREILIDPFHGGEILLTEDCRARLAESCGDGMALEPRFFQTSGHRAILTRMLANLKHVYLQAQEFGRALRVIHRLAALAPQDPHHLRDRGLAHAGLGHHARAADDFEMYLQRSPDAADAAAIRRHIKSLRRLTAMLN